MPQALPLQRCFNEQPILGARPPAEMISVEGSHRWIGGALQHAQACNERIMAHLYRSIRREDVKSRQFKRMAG